MAPHVRLKPDATVESRALRILVRRRLHQPDLNPPQFRGGAIAIRFEDLKVSRKPVGRPAGSKQMFLGHQCSNANALEPASCQSGLETRVEHGDGDQLLVIPHTRVQYRRDADRKRGEIV